MNPALLEVTGLRKQYGPRVILDDIDLTLRAGQACVLTGANGSGKSTLLRVLAGLESATPGTPGTPATLRLDGAALALAPYPARLRDSIGYVHQHPVMFSTTVADNIAYGLRGRGLSRAEIDTRVAAAIDWAGVAAVRNVAPARLSGGEKQRVALARARVLEPRLMLLDEPTSNLDGPAREQVLALIASLAGAGRAVLVVGHDRDIIALRGVQRYKLRDGKLEKR